MNFPANIRICLESIETCLLFCRYLKYPTCLLCTIVTPDINCHAPNR